MPVLHVLIFVFWKLFDFYFILFIYFVLFFLGGGQSSFIPCFRKNREAAYFFPHLGGRGLLARIFNDDQNLLDIYIDIFSVYLFLATQGIFLAPLAISYPTFVNITNT